MSASMHGPSALDEMGVRVRRADPAQAAAYVDALAEVLLDCVEGGASVGFLWPLPRERALGFWRGVADAVARGERVLLVAEDAHGGVLGTVQLIVAQPDNQPHRADVAKMLVRHSARRRGIAALLLEALEDAAREAGKRVLVLDTVSGSDAERVYARSGWHRVGAIPQYALMPDGVPCSTTYFYKYL